MAFVSKLGNVLKQTTMHVKSEMFPSAPSLYQTMRGMASSKLFVGGLSYNTTDESLKEVFNKYGTVIEARIIMDRDSGRSRGFGFVSFASENEASAAITAVDGQDIHGRMVRVNYATERTGGFRGGGYGGGGYGDGYGGGGGGGGYGGGGGSYQGPGGGYQGAGGGYQGGGGGGNYGGGGDRNYKAYGGYGGDDDGGRYVPGSSIPSGPATNYGGGGDRNYKAYGGYGDGGRYVPGSSIPSGPATSFQGDFYSKNKVNSYDSGAAAGGGSSSETYANSGGGFGGGDINNISNAPTNSFAPGKAGNSSTDDVLGSFPGDGDDEGLNNYDGDDALESGDDEIDDDFAKRT